MRGAQAADTVRFVWSRLVAETDGSDGFAGALPGLKKIAAPNGVIPERMGAGEERRTGSNRNPRLVNGRRPGTAEQA